MTLISAPAGYGKSTLASCWLVESDCPGAWLSLDERDNDLRLFLTYFLEAIRTHFPTALQETLALLKAGNLPPVSVLAASLLNELEGIEQEFILVLDDFHMIRDPSVLDLLAEVLRYPAEPMHLVLAGRRDPFLPMSSHRARGLVTEIRVQDLRFTAEETAAFLEGALVDRVEEATAAAWAQKTEGWVTGLRLAALSLRHQADAGAKVLEIVWTSRYVTEYFFEEVLAGQTPEVRQYLLRSSILDRFCAPLCDALFESGMEPGPPEIDGQGFITWLQENNLFLIPLDEENRWFRYHHLFQDLLRGQLERQCSAEEIAVHHSRAVKWFETQNLIEEALQHAMAAEDVSYAVHLVEQHRYDLMNNEEWRRLERWLKMLPPEALQKNPLLLATRAFIFEHRGQLAESFADRDRAESLLSALQPESPEQKEVKGMIAVLHGEQRMLLGEGDRALEHAERALRLLPAEALHILTYAIGLQVLCNQILGDIGAGLKIINEMLNARALLPGITQARMMLWFCIAYWMEGDLNGLKQPALQCLKLGEQHALPESISFGRYFLGVLHYVRNELSEAERYLAAVVDDPFTARPNYLVQSAFALARIYTPHGRDDEASNVIESVISHVMETNDTLALAVARAFQVELALRQRKIPEAQRLNEHAAYDLYPPVWFLYVPQLTPVKLLLAHNTSDSLEKAFTLLDQIDGFVRKTNRKTIRIDVLALQALILDAQGKEPAAFEKLSESLALAKPGGFIRNFVDLGPPTADLLERLKKQIEDTDYIDQVLAAFKEDGESRAPEASDAQAAPPPPTMVQPLIEPLTHRELETLELLTQGLYNKEIADRLSISVETVKSHLKNIFQKLGVSNRQQAVHRARSLDILPEKGS